MVNGGMICFGLCVEYQKVARADDFESHYDEHLMSELSERSGRGITELRATSVQHQIEVANEHKWRRAPTIVNSAVRGTL